MPDEWGLLHDSIHRNPTTPGRVAQVVRRPKMPYQVAVSYNAAQGYWILLEDFHYQDKNYIVNIPAGFVFDLASIPRIFWRLIGPHELSLAAPLVHDYLYRNGGNVPSGNFSRSDADWLFLSIMREEGVVTWRRWVAYVAVRLFGRKAFKK